jgi:hypothetical protein
MIPYRDFWENHTPLFHIIISLLFTFLSESSNVIIILRYLCLLPVILIFYLTYKLIESFSNQRILLYTIFFLCMNKWFIEKTCEARPDSILVLLSLAGIYFWIKGLESTKNRFLFISGLFTGLAFITSPKAIVTILALVFSEFLYAMTNKGKLSFKNIIKKNLIFLSGLLIPFIFLYFYLFFNNALSPFYHCFWTSVIKNPNRFSPASDIRKSFFINTTFWIFSIAGFLLFLYRFSTKKEKSIYHCTFLSIIILHSIIYYKLMPSPYPQSALILFPILSFYAANSFHAFELYLANKVHRRFGRIFLYTIIVFSVISPFVGFIYQDSIFENKNSIQKQKIDFILSHTPKDARIFDCQGFYIFRKPACYYAVLVKDVLIAMEKGLIHYDINADLIKNRCSMGIIDYRWTMLPKETIQFFNENFVMFPKLNLLLPGKLINNDESSSSIQFILRIVHQYIARSLPMSKPFLIDGYLTATPVQISSGEHAVIPKDNFSKIVILPVFTLQWDSDILNLDNVQQAAIQ